MLTTKIYPTNANSLTISRNNEQTNKLGYFAKSVEPTIERQEILNLFEVKRTRLDI
jgi:hypothetical protein